MLTRTPCSPHRGRNIERHQFGAAGRAGARRSGKRQHPNLTLSPARQRPYPGHKTIIAGRGAMDIDWRAEMKRPVTLGLAALAFIGWIVALSQLSAKTSLQASTAAQIGQLTAARQQLATELAQQQ